jgi:hypothetical protein
VCPYIGGGEHDLETTTSPWAARQRTTGGTGLGVAAMPWTAVCVDGDCGVDKGADVAGMLMPVT